MLDSWNADSVAQLGTLTINGLWCVINGESLISAKGINR
jgi:hypothetical protein